jgi:hypothetical protein
VASVLLNRDGTVQEAGSRVLSSAGTVQFARGMSEADADAAGLFDDRQIDYGSGAALLVRRSHFELVAGFDPLFEPAYFEDVDLCFRLCQHGAPVRLAGAARVLHLSGESTKGNRRFREFASWRSGIQFIRRWSATLDNAPAADAPLDELCTPARWTEPVTVTEPLHSSPQETALATATHYASWLNSRLDDVELDLSAAQQSLATANLEVDTMRSRLDVLTARLDDLDTRGPLGILKWKAGVATQRRNERKATR